MTYPIDENDVITEDEARKMTKCRTLRTWESWHEKKLIAWYRAPGTNLRLYSRAQLLEWLRSGAMGGDRKVG